VTALAAALALAAPGPIAGMALVLAYHRFAPIADTPAIVVLAYVARTWPYALLLLWPVVRSLPPEDFEAAELDGYSPAGQVLHIALPLTLGAIGLAWGAALVLTLGELSAVYLVTPPGHTSLTLRIWDKLHIPPESSLAGFVLVTLGVIAICGGLVAWAVARRLRRRPSS
jgi:iron(III) transport system permease protein